MSRLSRIVLIPLALAFTFMLPGAPGGKPGIFPGFEFGPAPAAADLLQCMESCIRHEGGNTATNKTTCKSRCANVPMGGPRAGPRLHGRLQGLQRNLRQEQEMPARLQETADEV